MKDYFDSINYDIDLLTKDERYLSLDVSGRVGMIMEMIQYSNLPIREYYCDCIDGYLDLFPYSDTVLKGDDKPVSAEEVMIRLCKCTCDEDIWSLMLKGLGNLKHLLSLYRGEVSVQQICEGPLSDVAASPERARRFVDYVKSNGCEHLLEGRDYCDCPIPGHHLSITTDSKKFFKSINHDVDRLVNTLEYQSLDSGGRYDMILNMILCSDLPVNMYVWDLVKGDVGLFISHNDYVQLQNEDEPLSGLDILKRLCRCTCDEDIWSMMVRGIGNPAYLLALYRGEALRNSLLFMRLWSVNEAKDLADRFYKYLKQHRHYHYED